MRILAFARELRICTRGIVRLAAGIKDIFGKPGTWFVVVGAGHLPGPRGIVALLAAHGAKAHRVMSDETVRQ